MGSGVLRILENDTKAFYCPGCKYNHYFDATWNWNGDYERPTVTPSILVFNGCSDPPRTFRCHLFVTDGSIHFLSDCEHGLAGQVVEMHQEV